MVTDDWLMINDWSFINDYPLANGPLEAQNGDFLCGKSAISMVDFQRNQVSLPVSSQPGDLMKRFHD